MKKDIIPLLYSAIAIIPIGGSSISSYLLSDYLRDFSETLRYLPLVWGLSSLSSILVAFYYFKQFLFEILAIVIAAPLLISYLNYKKYENIKIEVNEYYLEIKFEVPMKRLSFDNPSALFEYVFEKALKKIKPPYLFKLRNLDNCGNLKVIPRENSIILRKRCGDTVVEIIISNNDKADLKVTMPY
ncbi:hypothetical protein [Sulfurisphaera ohwakuensis]|uniref:Uncharacterized protein n=1 Tax=Sulfurisphaera ohwakuensis TaxID=69656 RepID=A0A650CHI7_SULOH|nr:hypothetical protein [Sulfurisphaera ohwakuensis]MBB5252309.1 hypothetical protein [Sulfurisphaera ohwakuensis]QGR17226.1 hypothetical protein D1869_08515 [Sulfurisphaera ohwakuensis]